MIDKVLVMSAQNASGSFALSGKSPKEIFIFLPEEWIKKYSLLFRVGEGRAENIKLSKYHFSVILLYG